MSGTAITRSQRISKIGVMDTLHAADEKDLSWEDVEGVSDHDMPALVGDPADLAGQLHRHRRRARHIVVGHGGDVG